MEYLLVGMLIAVIAALLQTSQLRKDVTKLRSRIDELEHGGL